MSPSAFSERGVSKGSLQLRFQAASSRWTDPAAFHLAYRRCTSISWFSTALSTKFPRAFTVEL
jgi:hypothetical protein